jgi:DivIVA domain-containing protein
MNVSPLDLRQHRFNSRFRGFDKIEVTALLTAVADDYETALRETDRLRQEVARMEAVLSEHRENEKNLRSTLMTAQKLSDDIKANAGAEADRIVRDADNRAQLLIREAEGRSQMLLDRTQSRLEDVQREIDGLRLKRKDVETTIESTMMALRNTLEYVREQEERDRDERVLLHRPRHADAAETPRTHDTRKMMG